MPLGTRRVFALRLTVEDSDNVTAPVLADAVISLAVPLIVVGRAVQVSEAPDASTPNGKLPAEQFAPLAANAVAVAALPVVLPDEPETLPVTFPVRLPLNVPVVVPGSVGLVGIDSVMAPVEALAVI
jgi:hypothetical protein